MKKLIISFIACLLMVFASIMAWCAYKDILAAALFVAAIIPSALFSEGWAEIKNARKDA